MKLIIIFFSIVFTANSCSSQPKITDPNPPNTSTQKLYFNSEIFTVDVDSYQSN